MKEIKTNYMVSRVTNRIEKELAKAVACFTSHDYKITRKQLYDGSRYLYVTSDKENFTSIALRGMISVADYFQGQYKVPAVCAGVTTIEKDGNKVSAFYVLVSKNYSNASAV